jgi:predicted ATPase
VAWAPEKVGDYQPLELPRTIRDSVVRRIATLSPELREVLSTVAVTGQGAGPELLAQVHAVSRLRAVGMLDVLCKRELLVEDGGRFRCAHRVVQDVVRQDLTPARRLELHRELALALESQTPPEMIDDRAGRIAVHADQGGEPELAHRYALRASQAAATRYAFEEALGWLELAAATARVAEEREEVNHRSTQLLQTAGLDASRASPRRRGTSPWGISREDLDLRVLE